MNPLYCYHCTFPFFASVFQSNSILTLNLALHFIQAVAELSDEHGILEQEWSQAFLSLEYKLQVYVPQKPVYLKNYEVILTTISGDKHIF